MPTPLDVTGMDDDDAFKAVVAAINELQTAVAALSPTSTPSTPDLTLLAAKVDRLEKKQFSPDEIAAFPENAPAA